MERTSEEVRAIIANIFAIAEKRQLAEFLGVDSRECVVPGHAYAIGERWIGPSYEQWWANGAWQKAGLNGVCQCGWNSPSLHRETEHWVDHLASCDDIDWDEVEREFTMRALAKLPRMDARPWHRDK